MDKELARVVCAITFSALKIAEDNSNITKKRKGIIIIIIIIFGIKTRKVQFL